MLWSRCVDAAFPDYAKVIQKPKDRAHVTMPRGPLIEALKVCLACASKDKLVVSLTREVGGLRVRLDESDAGSIDRLIPCRGWKPGQSIGLNARYLLDAARALQCDEATIGISDPASPVFLGDGELEAVIMPVRTTKPAVREVGDAIAKSG